MKRLVHRNKQAFEESLTQAEIAEKKAESFENKKQGTKKRIYNKREQHNKHDIIYNNNVFLGDAHAQQKFLEALSSYNAGILKGSITWTLKNGNTVDLNESDIKAIASQLLNRENANYEHARNLIELVESAQNLDELEAIDNDSGWTN